MGPNYITKKYSKPPLSRQIVPVLVVTSESEYHTVYDECMVDFLRAAGVSVDHVRLEKVGIHKCAYNVQAEERDVIVDQVVNEWLMKIR